MSLPQPGVDTSPISVTDISPDGLWVLVSNEEIFLPFDDFPWFKKATVEQILNVVEEAPGGYHWPDIDVDLDLDTMRHPKRYPLTAKQGGGAGIMTNVEIRMTKE